MEVFEVTPDWAVELSTPECDLRLANCTTKATQGMRVHGCEFHYVCNDCAHEFLRRVSRGYSLYRNMRCAACGAKFTRSSKYFNLIQL